MWIRGCTLYVLFSRKIEDYVFFKKMRLGNSVIMNLGAIPHIFFWEYPTLIDVMIITTLTRLYGLGATRR